MGLTGLYLASLAVGLAVRGPNHLFDGITAVLGTVVGLSLLALLWFAEGRLFEQAALFTAVFLIAVCPRLLSYLAMPDLVEFPFGKGIGSHEINAGLVYLLLGSGAIVAGWWMAEIIPRRYFNPAPTTPSQESLFCHQGMALLIFLVITTVEWLVGALTGVSPYGKLRADSGNTWVQILKGLFGSGTAYFVLLTTLLVRPVKNRLIIVLSALGYLLFLAASGSRNSGYKVLMMLLPIMLYLRGNMRATLTQYGSIFITLTLASVIIFPISSQIRINTFVESLKNHDQAREYEVLAKRDGTGLYSSSSRYLATIVNRMGAELLDYEVEVLSRHGDQAAIAKYMNISYAANSIINFCVPGVIFADAEFSTSRLMSVIYRGFTEDDLRTHGYHGEVWTAWGLAYVLFGWWGGLAALVMGGMGVHGGYLLASRLPGKWRLYLGAWYLWIVPRTFYSSMGLDHSITAIGVRLLQEGVAFGLLWYLTVLWMRHRQTG